MSDVLMVHTPDGGDITPDVALTDGFQTAVYLSLMGGQWWGDDSKGAFLEAVRTLPPMLSNLRRIEDAAASDLSWLTETGAASSVTITATMPALNELLVLVRVDDETVDYRENWRATYGDGNRDKG